MLELNQEYYSRQGQFSGLHGLLTTGYTYLLEEAGAELRKTNDKLEKTSEILEQTSVELIKYKQQANFWETEFRQLKIKESELGAMIEELKAELRKREQQIFGRKTERHGKKLEQQKNGETIKKRGQQVGSKGHGRRGHEHLPKVEEEISLKEGYRVCPCCGLPYEELAITEDAEVLEIINVKAYCRVIHRKKYRRCCQCKKEGLAQIITAPSIDRLLPKSTIGTSIWAFLLLRKYEYQQPTYRTLKELTNGGLSLSLGTVTDGFCKLLPFLSPVYDAVVKRNVEAKHWHADETGWKVFETVEGKNSHRWYLWIFSNNETVVYKLDPSRSSKVLSEHFAEKIKGREEDKRETTEGILNVDRYVAYKVIAKTGLFTLSFCWAHVRRGFLEYSKAYPKQEAWGLSWVERIGKLYQLNQKRIEHGEDKQLFIQDDQRLREEIRRFETTLDQQLDDVNLLPSAKKLLKSLKKHWDGLTVFVEQPDIPMDNNEAERGLRSSVVGRKNYYGSFAVWSGKLAAALFTIFATMKRWKINPHTWLIAYFQECSALGEPPSSECINKFLPWNMTEELRLLFSKPPTGENTS